MDALQQFLTEFKRVSNAIVDSYFIVDTERRIVDFNRAFFALLPRQVARGLKGKHCYEVLELNICKNECIAQQCWADNRHVRLDEISGTSPARRSKLRFILSAVPITDEAGNHVGALEIQRNVTDEAVVQVKYQEMLETEARERERLAEPGPDAHQGAARDQPAPAEDPEGAAGVQEGPDGLMKAGLALLAVAACAHTPDLPLWPDPAPPPRS